MKSRTSTELQFKMYMVNCTLYIEEVKPNYILPTLNYKIRALDFLYIKAISINVILYPIIQLNQFNYKCSILY